MKKDVDFLLNLAADSSKVIKDDKLARILSEYEDEDELSEDELDEVCAAAKPDIEKLMRKLKDNGNNG